jgi:hypothetical protein
MFQTAAAGQPYCATELDQASSLEPYASIVFARARDVYVKEAEPEDLAYLAIRPTVDFGDYTVSSCVDDAEECQIQFGEPARPCYAASIYDSIANAIDDALAIIRHHPHLRLWYNGQETQAEFAD